MDPISRHLLKVLKQAREKPSKKIARSSLPSHFKTSYCEQVNTVGFESRHFELLIFAYVEENEEMRLDEFDKSALLLIAVVVGKKLMDRVKIRVQHV